MAPVETPSITWKSNCRKNKKTYSSVILESGPLKLKSKSRKRESKPDSYKVNTNNYYEPMTDLQLAQALGLTEAEVTEAFEDNIETDFLDVLENYNNTLRETFYDEDFELDVSGLHLIEENGIITSNKSSRENSDILDDDELAAIHGYSNVHSGETDELTTNFGYQERNDASNDDEKLVVDWGYAANGDNSKDDSESSDEDDRQLAAEFGYDEDGPIDALNSDGEDELTDSVEDTPVQSDDDYTLDIQSRSSCSGGPSSGDDDFSEVSSSSCSDGDSQRILL